MRTRSSRDKKQIASTAKDLWTKRIEKALIGTLLQVHLSNFNTQHSDIRKLVKKNGITTTLTSNSEYNLQKVHHSKLNNQI